MGGPTISPRRGSTAAAGLRYLRYESESGPAGINHQLRNLQWLMREAFALGRLALLPPLDLHARHNFGVDRSWCWDAYFDLEASRLIDVGGTAHPLPLVRTLPDGLRPVRVQAMARADRADLGRPALLVRRMSGAVYEHDLRGHGFAATRFRMRPSQRVVSLARPVLAAIGARAPCGFAAVHVRRGDRLRWPCVARATRPEAVLSVLARRGVAPGATVFVLSDECDPAWWTPLAARHCVVRSLDFPELAQLVEPAATPDNYLLYEVEKEVMRHANLRIETLPGDYAPSDATLVSPTRWFLARPQMLRRAATHRLRRVMGEHAWAVFGMLRRAAIRRLRRAMGEHAWAVLRGKR